MAQACRVHQSLGDACPGLGFSQATDIDGPMLTIPAWHSEVGDITARFDGEEITVDSAAFEARQLGDHLRESMTFLNS